MSPTRFILTGAPGAGKTVLIHALAERGFAIAEEAATDVIAAWQRKGVAEPWTRPEFIEAIADLQSTRLASLESAGPSVQFYDRSIFCTIALAEWLGHGVPTRLHEEAERTVRERVYRPDVFFVESLGFITPTEARRISLEDAQRFGELHKQVYGRYGFQLVSIPAGSVAERLAHVLSLERGPLERGRRDMEPFVI